MGYQDNLDRLQRFGVHLGLERIQALLTELGNPEQSFPVIHVAGTNGKGSVCAYLSHMLQSAGYRVGRYTSPHLIDWRERIWIDGALIPSEDFQACLQRIDEAANRLSAELGKVTQFEVLTAAAFIYFAQQKIDVGVIEVGLGGRLDATNVFKQPLVSVITGISYDHQEQLGSTLTEIAREKAGILRSGTPLVSAPLGLEARQAVAEMAKRLGVAVTIAYPARRLGGDLAQWEAITYQLPLAGDVQLQNSATALQVCRLLQHQGWKITDQDLTKGIALTTWAGRCQWIEPDLLIDGAHNPQAAQYLRQYLDQGFAEQPIVWIIGILKSKDAKTILSALIRPMDQVFTVPVPDAVCFGSEELADLAQTLGAHATPQESWQVALQNSPKAAIKVLCGSLYLVGDFLSARTAELPR
ncbi:MAG: bifunctional folylpolyglutamate synthase/dihydrofolate synthase [Anaerolineae bacterium]|nr:bifunctional folylpolyglutamate synthase/dihydrofolate synthase [Gloeobacterales cyanobacterium ES-bin-313]